MTPESSDKPRFRGRLHRATLGLLAALIALVAAPALASAAPTVHVTPVHGAPAMVDLRDLRGEEDITDVGYAIRSQSSSEQETITGFSLEKILVKGGVDIYTFSYVEIVRPGAGSVLLSRAQVREDGAFPDGQPVVFEHGGNAGFLRPSADPSDYNSDDFFDDAPLRVIAHDGQLIEVEAKASKTKAKVGEEITFSATVTRQASGSVPEINWSFGDGPRKSGAKVTHSFSRPGTWKVAVGATTADDRTGGSAMVTVQVGEPKKGGPDREGGGKDKDKDAGDKGASDDTGGQQDGTGDSDSTGTSTTPGPAAPSTTAPVAPPREKTPKDKDSEQTDDLPGERVTGDLLSDEDLAGAEVIDDPAANKEEEAPQETLRTGTPSEESGFTVPGAALAGVGAVGLIGLGALAEMGALAGAGAALRRRFEGIRAKMSG